MSSCQTSSRHVRLNKSGKTHLEYTQATKQVLDSCCYGGVIVQVGFSPHLFIRCICALIGSISVLLFSFVMICRHKMFFFVHFITHSGAQIQL